MSRKTTKVFANGGSQAVRIPAEFRFDTEEVTIEREGDALVLRPVRRDWATFFADPEVAPEDFLSDRADGASQRRDPL